MRPRKRFALLLGLTVLVAGAAVAFMIWRAAVWHERGWAGVTFLAGPNTGPQAKMMGLEEGSVMMTSAGGPADGKLLGWIDLGGISPDDIQRDSENVLNGIAYDAATDRIFVTGKRWKKLFEIKLKPKQ